MTSKKTGRNDPCPCGSGKKYKQCCLPRDGGTQDAKPHSTDAPIPEDIQTALEHHQTGRLDHAEAIYRQILKAVPNHPDALHFSGLLAHQTGKNDTALELMNRAIGVNPSNPVYYINLGNTLRTLGKLEEATDNYRKALALEPGLFETHYNLGNTLQAQGKLDEAISSFKRALAFKPDYAEAHCKLGNVFQMQGKLDLSAESYRKALSIRPGYAEVYYNLGIVFQAQLKLDEALDCYKKALALEQDFAENYNFADVHNNMGNVLRSQGRLDEALASYNKALSIKPGCAGTYSNLLFLHGYHGSLNPQEYLSLARGWEQACLPAQDRQTAHDRVFLREPAEGRRLKVGYVSGDFRQHAVSYFIEQIFTHHDRTRIELYAYSTSSQRDTVTGRLQALADHWIPIAAMQDAAARDRIEADGIDVLVDLSGHTEGNRLGIFARRAAPVQANYLGYFASTGLTEMDYWIGDDILTPPEMDSHFSEQVWRLPRVWVSYKTITDAPEPDWRPASDGSVWVGSFNNLGKITPQTIALWARVLHALPQGLLLLKTKELASAANRQRIRDAMADHGISPDRMELQRESGWADYMAQYNRLDIALDPVGGHGGGTITCDALWMGVPVIHALGNRATSRFTASMLNAIGRTEWVAHSETEYVDKVVALARDVELRKTLRPGQRSRMASSPLCDARSLTTNLENAYLEMFERWLVNPDVHRIAE